MATITSLKFDISAKWDGTEIRKAQADLAKLQGQLDALNGKKIKIEADTSGSAQIDDLKEKLDTVKKDTTIKLSADTLKANEDVERFREKIRQLGTETARPKVDVETGKASAAIDYIKAKLRSLNGGGGGSGGGSSGGGGLFAKMFGGNSDQIGIGIGNLSFRVSGLTLGLLYLNAALGAGILLLGALGAAGALAGSALMLALPTALTLIAFKFATMTTAGKKAFAQLKSDLASTLQNAAQPMIKAIIDGFGQLDAGVKKLAPGIKSLFSAAAPTIQPFINAILLLVQSMLPGMVAALKAMAPVMQGLQLGMQDLGRNVGQMFTGLSQGAAGFGSAIRITLGQVGIFLGQLGTAWGQTANGGSAMLQGLLEGVNNLVSAMNNDLIPAVQTMGGLMGGFLGQLGTSLGNVLGSVFRGVQILGPALQPLSTFLAALATGLGSLITGLASGLTPAIRAMSGPLSQLVMVIGSSLGGALKLILPVLGQLIAQLATALAPIITALVPPLAQIIAALLSGFEPVLRAITPILVDAADALGTILGWLRPIMPILGPLAVGIWALTAAWGALDASMIANPIGLVVAALAALVLAIVYLATRTQFFQKLWDDVWNGIKIGFNAFVNFMRTPFGIFAALLMGPIGVLILVAANWKTIWDGILTAGLYVWHAINLAWDDTGKALKSAWDTVSNALKGAWDVFWSNLKQDAAKPWQEINSAWHDTINGLKSAWDTVSGTISSAWSSFWNGLVSTAKTIWTGIEDVFKTPINVVISIWDSVAGVFGLPKVNKLADGGMVGNGTSAGIGHGALLAGGGHVRGPGTSTSDDIPAWLSDGEFVMPAKRVKQYGVGMMEQMRSGKFADGGLVGMQGFWPGGGVVGGIVHLAKKGVSGLTGLVEKGLDALKNITADVAYDVAAPIVHGVESGVPDPFMSGVTEPLGGMPKDMITKVGEGILSIFKHNQDSAKSAMEALGGALPTAAHEAILQGALKRAGVAQSDWPKWLAGLNTLITRESGWNPSSINLTDSNAKAGHPSQGLMQLIPGTFAAYGMGGSITDPVSNVVAGIRYILSRYGDISKVQQANAHLAPKGYDMGGPLLPGLTLANNTTGTVEGVLNPTGLAAVGGISGLTALNSGNGFGALVTGTQSGGGITLNINIEVNEASDMDVDELVAEIEAKLVPKITMAITAKVGSR